jgi:hypothetical protein
MPSSSFAALKNELDEACLFLRSFTLGQQGFTLRDGIAGIERVDKQCERMSKAFASGPCAKQVATLVASARSRVRAAQTRLELLTRKT